MKKALRRLDSVHKKLLDAVSTLELQRYSQRPADGEWSVAEIVHHLCLVEDRVIKELEGAIGRAPQRVGFFRRLIPTSIVSVRLIRVKAPKAMNPLDAPAKDVALENYDRTRNRLKHFAPRTATSVSATSCSSIRFWARLTAWQLSHLSVITSSATTNRFAKC
jgi:hypothetical protein